MSLHTATTSDRERVRAHAQIARAAEQSRHEISKLALELLQQRHRAQHVANAETREQELAYADSEFEKAATKLALKHNKEAITSEDAKFALFDEFDAKRQAWAAAASKTEVPSEECSKHEALVHSLAEKKLSDDKDALAALQSAIREVTRSSVTYP